MFKDNKLSCPAAKPDISLHKGRAAGAYSTEALTCLTEAGHSIEISSRNVGLSTFL